MLRGLQDTRTPLVVAVLGNGVNIVLNLLLVYGVVVRRTGIAGSAIGTVLAQALSAVGAPPRGGARRPRHGASLPRTSPGSGPRLAPGCRW